MESESASSLLLDLHDLRSALPDIRQADQANSPRATQRATGYTQINQKHLITKPPISTDASAVAPEEPQPAQSWAHLPHDILHELCRTLRHSGQVETLSALRLTCKTFVPVVTVYLFHTIHLDRTMASIQRLTALSDTHLAEYVREVNLDAEMMLEPRDHTQWSSTIDSLTNTTFPERDHWWGRSAYEVALARQRDLVGLSTTVHATRWRNYQELLLEQQDLDNIHPRRLQRVLRRAFGRLTNVTWVECKAYYGSKYVLLPTVPMEDSVKQVRQTFLRTMTMPPFDPRRRRMGKDRFGAVYVAAVAYASLSSSPKLEHLSFIGTQEDAFHCLQTFLPFPTCMSLKSLVISPFSRHSWWPGLSTEIQSCMASLIRTAPNLQALTICECPQATSCSPRCFDRKMPTPSLPWHLGQLENLVFKEMLVHAEDLRLLFQGLPPTMRRVELGDIELRHGLWVDMFEVMRDSTSGDCKFSMHGIFNEVGTTPTTVNTDPVWVAGEEITIGSLMSQLLAYIEKRCLLSPLRTLEAGGSAEEWVDVSDESLRYVTILDWLDEHDE